VRAADRRVREERLLRTGGDRTRSLRDRQGDLLPRLAHHFLVARTHDLHVSGRTAEARPVLQQPVALASDADLEDRQPRGRLRAFDQRLVHLVAELVAHEHVDEKRGERDGDRDRRGGGDDQTCPKAHGSRRT
jgi:hypothetical protein